MKLQRYFRIVCTCISLLFFMQSANATLQLVLTHGVDAAVPIAIMPFRGADAKTEVLMKVMQRDLTNSGKFNVRITKATSTNGINYEKWRAQKIDNLITGSITPLPDKKYRVTFQLLDVLAYKHELLQREFIVSADHLRILAHRMSDLVYKQLTGDQGIFSTRIAYVLVKRKAHKAPRYILEVADADGYNPKPLLISGEPIMSPAWSPDGKKIAYVSFERARSQIYIEEVATGKRQLVSRAPGINGAPAWSPDGNQLAFVLSKSGHPKIYVQNLKTQGLRQVTHGSSIDTEPSWAPDGKSLIFTSDRGGSPQIYRVILKSGKLRRITYQGNYNARASFTPDEQGIVLLHRNRRLFNIAYYDLNRDRIQILTKSGADESPSLAPNGKLVLYATQDKGYGVLGMSSTDGRVQLRLPARDGAVQEPAWSPFLS